MLLAHHGLRREQILLLLLLLIAHHVLWLLMLWLLSHHHHLLLLPVLCCCLLLRWLNVGIVLLLWLTINWLLLFRNIFRLIIRLFSICRIRGITSFHLEELRVHFLHFRDSLLVLFYILCFLCIRCHFLTGLYFLHERGWVLSCFIDAVDSCWIDVVRKRRWVQLL